MLMLFGHTYIDPEKIIAVQCDGDRVGIALEGGVMFAVDWDAKEVPEFLSAAGLLPNEDVREVNLPEEEVAELWDAWESGCQYAAMDSDGKVWAYRERPLKGPGVWNDGGTFPRRLYGEFNELAFEDEEPLSLRALFDTTEEGDGI